jgi:alkyl hydroperoxide reductase subunit AhpC
MPAPARPFHAFDKVSDLHDMIHPNADDTQTVGSVFVVGPDNKVKLTLTYPASTGRNFDVPHD